MALGSRGSEIGDNCSIGSSITWQEEEGEEAALDEPRQPQDIKRRPGARGRQFLVASDER